MELLSSGPEQTDHMGLRKSKQGAIFQRQYLKSMVRRGSRVQNQRMVVMMMMMTTTRMMMMMMMMMIQYVS